jgi:hypothetical protein
MPETIINEPAEPIRTRDRWLLFLIVSLVINLGSAFTFPMFVTDAFSWPALLVCLPPIVWAGFLLFRYRARGERLVSYAAVLGALYWLLPAIGLVVEFGGR